MFRHGIAALNASPEPKKKTKGKQIVKKPVKTTPNSSTQSTSAGASSQNRNGGSKVATSAGASSQNRNGASKVAKSAGASFQNRNGASKVAKISSPIDVSSDDDCDDQPATPSSLLNLLFAQVLPVYVFSNFEARNYFFNSGFLSFFYCWSSLGGHQFNFNYLLFQST